MLRSLSQLLDTHQLWSSNKIAFSAFFEKIKWSFINKKVLNLQKMSIYSESISCFFIQESIPVVWHSPFVCWMLLVHYSVSSWDNFILECYLDAMVIGIWNDLMKLNAKKLVSLSFGKMRGIYDVGCDW